MIVYMSLVKQLKKLENLVCIPEYAEFSAKEGRME